MYSLFDASIGTEELNHIEMVCTIVHQLTRNLTVQQIKEQGFADYYVDHTTGIYSCGKWYSMECRYNAVHR